MLNNPFSQASAQAPATPISTQTPPTSNTTTPASGELPRPYKCPMCSKAFHRLEHQTRHIRTHTGEKPHACSFHGCSKRFSRSDELTRHARIHTNPNSRRNGRNTGGQPNDSPHLLVPTERTSGGTSESVSPNVSPPNYGMPLNGHYQNGKGSAFDEMHVLASAASQQLEQEKARSQHHNSYYPAQQRHATFASHTNFNSNGHHYSSGPYNRPTLSMSRQHSEELDDASYDHRRYKRSCPGSPVSSTAPNSPPMSHKHSPTPDHTPLVTPAHSPRLHPRELDLLNGIHLPSIRQLSLRGMPPPLTPLEVDPFQPGSGYNSPQHPRHQAPVNAMKLSDILESTTQNHNDRTLPLPRASMNNHLSQSPGSGNPIQPTYGNSSGTHNRSASSSASQSRNNSHSNLRDLL